MVTASCFLALAGLACQPVGAASELQKSIEARLDGLPSQSSLYAKHLSTGRSIAVRADQPMNTVSVIKLPIMLLAYREAEAGRLDLDERRVIRHEELRRGTGLLHTFAPGLAPTWRDLVAQMIVTSDNTATDILIGRLGLPRVNELLTEIGYQETRLQATIGQLFRGVWEQLDPGHARLTDREVFERGFPEDAGALQRYFVYTADPSKWLGRTSARETGRWLEQLERGELAGAKASAEMRETLKRQLYFSRLPQRIRFRVEVGHKTGDWPPIIGNDVGILYAESGPIVVAAFTNQNRGSFFELEAALGEIAEDLLDAWGTK